MIFILSDQNFNANEYQYNMTKKLKINGMLHLSICNLKKIKWGI